MSETELPQNKQLPWQNAIDRRLQQRLLRPLFQPGLVNTSKLADIIILRSQSLSERLPLLAQINQRWSSVTTQAVNDIPLVYAQSLPSQDNSVKTPNSPAGSSRTNLQVATANPLSTPGNIREKFNLLETPPVVKGQSRSIPTVQAKFTSDNQSNLISQSRQTDLSLSKEGNQKSTDVFPGIQESGNLEKVLSPNYSVDLININRNVYLEKISDQELPLISAKLDLPLQSPDILSLNYFENSVDNNSRESELPLVKITPESNFTPTERTALLLNQISVDQPLISEDSQPPLVRKNLVPSWQGLNTELLLPIAPLKSYRTVAANEREDLVNKQYNLGEKSKNPKTHEVAIARTVTHPASNNSTSLPIQTQEAFPIQTDSKNQIDLDSLANKVERKLMRRLAIESERRGQKRWR